MTRDSNDMPGRSVLAPVSADSQPSGVAAAGLPTTGDTQIMTKSAGDIEADINQILEMAPQYFSHIPNSLLPPFMSGQPTSPECGYPSTLLNALVAQTLDDLEEEHLDLETALHALARIAFNAGQRGPRPNSDH
jgi:hypothetical protein